MTLASDGRSQSSPNAYLFPGQGSHIPGMGHDLYEQSRAAQNVFETVDNVLQRPLSQTIFQGPAEELARTINAQPAIFACSLAALRSMEEMLPPSDLPRPYIMAGHSLGEYTALVAADALDLEDGIRLVGERGRLMQEASDQIPSGLVAVLGMDQQTVEDICTISETQIANVNSADQIVIGGDKPALVRFTELATIRGARKCVPLDVSGAFHTKFMQPALDRMVETLQTIRVRAPLIPVVANCTGKPMTTASQIEQELACQLCSRVEWQSTIEYMLAMRVSRFLEIGPGRILSGLVKRIDRNVSVQSINNIEDIRSLKSPADGLA
jgi:[acyl-carrier-protein] S-malonyltransferase